MVLYKAESAAIGVTDGSISQISTLSVAVSQAAASKFVVTGASTQTSGLANALTISAKDAYGNAATAYTGDKSLTFSGANANGSPVLQPSVTDKTGPPVNFGTATTITFTNGVSSAGGSMILYKNETASIVATQGGITTTGAVGAMCRRRHAVARQAWLQYRRFGAAGKETWHTGQRPVAFSLRDGSAGMTVRRSCPEPGMDLTLHLLELATE